MDEKELQTIINECQRSLTYHAPVHKFVKNTLSDLANFVDAEAVSDVYGSGTLIEDFELARAARRLADEALAFKRDIRRALFGAIFRPLDAAKHRLRSACNNPVRQPVLDAKRRVPLARIQHSQPPTCPGSDIEEPSPPT